MTNEELQAIRARCDAATPGPWVQKMYAHCEDHDEMVIELVDDTIENSNAANARFIAHSREDVPKLLDSNDILRESIVLHRHHINIIETDRDRWKARAEALYRLVDIIEEHAPCWLCTHEDECECSNIIGGCNSGNFQFDKVHSLTKNEVEA